MIGNMWEWVAWWGQSGKVNASFSSGAMTAPWPVGYGDGKDKTWNVNGEAHNGTAWTSGMPAAALRGGDWYDGDRAGVFTVGLTRGPTYWHSHYSARCCRQ